MTLIIYSKIKSFQIFKEKISNTVLICWGEYASTQGAIETTFLPCAYTKNYVVVLSKSDGDRYGPNGQSWTSLVSQTLSYFTSHNNIVSWVHYMSIGV